MKLPEKILYCRKRAGLSQEELAGRLGVSRQAVSKWETGEAQPELSKLAPLAAELGVSVDWLLSDAEPEEPRAEPERAEDWTDKLPRLLRGAARRWGWLAGVYLAVVGALFAGMGALARAVSRSMFESAASLVGDADILTGGGLGGLAQSGMGLLMDASGQLAQFSRNNPVYLFGGVLLVFGLVLCAAGVVLAVVLRRMGRRGDK